MASHNDSAQGGDGSNGERYSKLEKLGEGTYGVVFKAVARTTQELVALKKIRVDAWEDGVPATAMREISVLKSISHPCVVRWVVAGKCSMRESSLGGSHGCNCTCLGQLCGCGSCPRVFGRENQSPTDREVLARAWPRVCDVMGVFARLAAC